MSKHKIGLFGFGCVGQGFHELLQNNPALDAEIVKVCVKHADKERSNVPGTTVYNPDEILNDDDIDIVVEVIDDAGAAYHIVQQALSKGKKVVSANKKMIAENLKELLSLQQANKATFLYEGAVCGSIPILSSLRNYYAHDNVYSIKGIFNGSTNYILTKVIEEGQSYDDALEEAQSSGFAESDPFLDVAGFDPAFKLSILIKEVFGTFVDPDDILKIGIQQISKADVTFAHDNNLKIKLIAQAYRQDDALHALVAPQFVVESNQFSTIDYEYNAVKLSSQTFGHQFLVGKGAGELPTGLAVLSDVAAIVNNSVSNTVAAEKDIALNNGNELEVYLGFERDLEVDWSLFSTIKEKFVGKHYGHTIGKTTIANLKRIQELYPQASIILTSGKEIEINLAKLTYNNVTQADKA